MKTINCDVMILGAGAGGFGACYTLIKNGISVAIADINPGFGGTAVFSGISCFEPGVSLDGVHKDIAQRLLNHGSGQVQKSVPSRFLFEADANSDDFSEPLVTKEHCWGLSVACSGSYESTLKRCKSLTDGPLSWRRFMTDEEALTEAMNEITAPYSKFLTTLFGYKYISCKTDKRKILSVRVSNGEVDAEIYAKFFVDSSGSIVMARDAGCMFEIGHKGDLDTVNGVTVAFRVSKNASLNVNTVPNENIEEWKKTKLHNVVSCFNVYPNGDININMLPTLTGRELFEFGEDAYNIGVARVLAYWEYLRKKHRGLLEYKISKIFKLGIREDYRLIGKKVLEYKDIEKGVINTEKVIAIADHAIDTHGIAKKSCGELDKPYEIPVECTMSKEYDNMFVACRGASFSSTVASSARLTRTMMSMGEGVGEFIANKYFKN